MLARLLSCCTKARATSAASASTISVPAIAALSTSTSMKKLSIENTDLKGKRVVRVRGNRCRAPLPTYLTQSPTPLHAVPPPPPPFSPHFR